MNYFSISKKPSSISGDTFLNLKQTLKTDSNLFPVIQLEELNSGAYALKRLYQTVETLNGSPVAFLSKIAAPPQAFPNKKNNYLRTNYNITRNLTSDQIKENTALTLIPLIETGLTDLLNEVTVIDLSKIPDISIALINMRALSSATSLNTSEQNTVFDASLVPTNEQLHALIKQEQEEELNLHKEAVRKQLESQGATEDYILEYLEAYENFFIDNFRETHIDPSLLMYRTTIGEELSKMYSQLESSLPAIPELTIDNMEEVNARLLAQTMYESLNDLINQTPEAATNSEIVNLQDQLINLLNSSSLTANQIETIYNISDQPSESILNSFFSEKQIAAYRENIALSYQNIMLNISDIKLEVINERETLENQLYMFQSAETAFRSLMEATSKSGYFSDISAVSEKVGALLEMYGSLITLSNAMKILSPEEVSVLKPIIEEYLDLPYNLAGESIETVLGKEIASFLAAHKVTSISSIIIPIMYTAAMQQEGNKLSQEPLLEVVGAQVAADNGPFITIIDNFFSVDYGKLVNSIKYNVTFTALINQNNALTESKLLSNVTPYILQKQAEIEALKKKEESLESYNIPFFEERYVAIAKWIQSESLGQALQTIILESQLPKQKAFLEPIMIDINFNNYAAKALNDIQNITNEFSVSSVYYNLSSSLIQSEVGAGYFDGNYFDSALAYARLKETIAKDLYRCRLALDKAYSIINNIQKLTNITSSQRTDLLAVTSNYIYLLNSSIIQLSTLEGFMPSIIFVPVRRKASDGSEEVNPKLYEIKAGYDWIPQLGMLENLANNGFPRAQPSGGLGPIFTQIQSDQQNYTSQSQTQQLSLQNHMTNIQQEWTLVATSLQILNQILTILAGEIYAF